MKKEYMEQIKLTLIRAWLFISFSIVIDDDDCIELYGFTNFEKMIGCIATLFLVATLITIPFVLFHFYWNSYAVSFSTIVFYVFLNLIIIGKSLELLYNLVYCTYLFDEEEDEIQI